MFSTFEDIIFCLVLLVPLSVFVSLMRKHWLDNELKKAFWSAALAGCAAVVIVRLVYVPIEIYLGGDIRQFLSGSRKWYITLIACIGIVGFVEEGLKALAAHGVCCLNGRTGFRSTFVFMSFAGCALGFSLLENVQYYAVYGPTVVLPRILISSVAHLAFSCICSYFSSKAFSLVKSPFKTALLLNIGIVAAAIFHGAFDYVLFQYSVVTLSGLIIALISLFLYAIYEIWIHALKNDLPPVGFLAVCSNCRALTVERIRFCPFCGNRVAKIDSLPTVVRMEEKD